MADTEAQGAKMDTMTVDAPWSKTRLCTCKQRPNPPVSREPSCEHDSHQPASACRVCKDGPRLRAWIENWAAYWKAHTGPDHTARPPQ